MSGVRELNEEEGRALFDRVARYYLGMSGEEFLDKWDAGEIDFDGPQHSDIVPVYMVIPFARGNV